jgi:chlorobactene glucosyltransferase
MQTTSEKTTVPLMHYLLLNLLPLRLVYLAKNASIAVACGQCMLFDADIYTQNQCHKQVKGKIPDDTEIMKLLKTKSYNGEVLLANGMVSSRDYRNYPDAINGFSKNLLPAFNYNIFALLIYILLIVGGPMVVLTTLNLNLIFFMTGLIVLTRTMISLSTSQHAWYNILLHPLQMINLVIITFLSIQRHLTRSVVWKGRRV